jgi:G patch domain-containing protein 1
MNKNTFICSSISFFKFDHFNQVYGCILPPGPASNEKGGNEHDIYAEGLLFAPKDTTTIKFTPKDNLHGIGYQGMLAPKPMDISKPGFSGNLKIKGQVSLITAPKSYNT